MILKVKHDELEEVTTVMKNNKELLEEEIKKLLEQIEKLKTIWQGQDADMFYTNVSNYLTKMQSIPKCLGDIRDFVNKINNKYTENDESFSKELDTELEDEVIIDEQNNNN